MSVTLAPDPTTTICPKDTGVVLSADTKQTKRGMGIEVERTVQRCHRLYDILNG